jgi:hypothetical protein
MSKSKKKSFAQRALVEREEELLTDEKLRALNLQRKPLPKDGSCLFRACSEQLFHTQFYHQRVRSLCVDFLQSHREFFEHYVVEMPFDDYCRWMRHETRWGGQVELECLAQAFKCNIRVYSSRGIEAEHTYNGSDVKDVPLLRLCFLNGNHYDSVYDTDFFQSTIICQDILYDDILNKGLGIEIPPIPDIPNAWKVVGADLKGTFRNVEYDVWKEQLKERQDHDMKLAISMSNKKKKKENKNQFPILSQKSPPAPIEPAEPVEPVEGEASSNLWSKSKDWNTIFSAPPEPEPEPQEQPAEEIPEEPIHEDVHDAMPIVDSHDLTVKRVKTPTTSTEPAQQQQQPDKKKKKKNKKNKKEQVPAAVEPVVQAPVETAPAQSVWGVKKEWTPPSQGNATSTEANGTTDEQLKNDRALAKKLQAQEKKKENTSKEDEEWVQVEKKTNTRAPTKPTRGHGQHRHSKF